MKENVFDVLIYLFENYMDSDVEMSPDPEVLRTELMEAGFPQVEINRAFDWLDSLTEHQAIQPLSSPTFRVFSPEEMAKLDTASRGLLMFLEQSAILTPAVREVVIDRVMAIDEASMSLEDLKWVILMVLFSRPDEEIAFARMENLVYESLPAYLH